ncbi:MAG TPA: hypothetical protein VD814_09545 [Nocardioides sp.]|nr:hypothetical protein [Nocardioides sp.]
MTTSPTDGSVNSAAVDCAELVDLLGRQHEELRAGLDRIAQLQGCAREDVFLQVRRQLAVHAALEELVIAPRTGKGTELAPLHREVEVAEAVERDSGEFDRALARMVRAHGRHVRVQEQDHFGCLAGPLTEEERAVLEVAARLWEGEGEAYLGSTYDRMRSVAQEQLARPEESEPGPAG